MSCYRIIPAMTVIVMLDYCAVGVAMGNGSDEIKAKADFVTGNVENDGLYQAFEMLGLI